MVEAPRKRRRARGPILVTGAAGAVGRQIVEALRALRVRVIAHGRPESLLPAERQGLEVRAADLSQVGAAAEIAAGAGAVIHAAWAADPFAPAEQREADVAAAVALYDAAREAGARRFVFLSSGQVYRPNATGIYREEDPVDADSPFGRAKLHAEHLLQERARGGGPELLVLRLAPLYWPGIRYRTATLACLGSLISALPRLPLMPIPTQGGPRCTLVHVEDAARAAAHLLEHGAPGTIYHVSDQDAPSIGDLIGHSLASAGQPPSRSLPYPPLPLLQSASALLDTALEQLNPLLARHWAELVQRHGLEPAIHPGIPQDLRACLQRDLILLNDRLVATGFRIRHPSILLGFKDTLAWYRDHRWIP